MSLHLCPSQILNFRAYVSGDFASSKSWLVHCKLQGVKLCFFLRALQSQVSFCMLVTNVVFRSKMERLSSLFALSHLSRGQWRDKGNLCALVPLTHTHDFLMNPVTTITTGWTNKNKNLQGICLILCLWCLILNTLKLR